MLSTRRRLTGAVVLLVLAACGASTRFVNTWKAPDAAPLALRPGDTVVAMVISRNEVNRRSGEDALAAELSRRGLRVIPAYAVLTVEQAMERESALERLRATGAVAAFVVRPLRTTHQATYVPPTYSAAVPYGSWGPYYGYGWGAPYSPGYVVTDTVVRLEVLAYDLRQEKLIWAGQSETTNPDSLDSFARDVVKAAAREMTRAGVLAEPS
ncbi:MAG TPA: DUF4136 domain-containing protein [Myxococcaceae bacterium]|nr:DUF4136 domain-containing protein [Myxococcaceae bacterium]